MYLYSEFSVFQWFLLQKRCAGGISASRPVDKTQARRYQNQTGAKSEYPRPLLPNPGVSPQTHLPSLSLPSLFGRRKGRKVIGSEGNDKDNFLRCYHRFPAFISRAFRSLAINLLSLSLMVPSRLTITLSSYLTLVTTSKPRPFLVWPVSYPPEAGATRDEARKCGEWRKNDGTVRDSETGVK